MYFQKKSKSEFYKFKHEDLKEYQTFKNVLLAFIKYYDLDCWLKSLDRYLRQLGKNIFLDIINKILF